MRAFFCLFFCSLVGIQLSAQEKLFTCGVFEKDACTDYQEWSHYINKYAQPEFLPLDSLAPGKYTINIQLVIDKEGKVNVMKVLDDPGYGIGQKLKQALEQYPYKWQPAERNGRKVKNYRMQPITFIIEEEEECSGSTAALML